MDQLSRHTGIIVFVSDKIEFKHRELDIGIDNTDWLKGQYTKRLNSFNMYAPNEVIRATPSRPECINGMEIVLRDLNTPLSS